MTVTVKKKQKQITSTTPETKVTVITKESANPVATNVQELEDDFQGLYYDTTSGEGNIIKPTYDLSRLQDFVAENNSLLGCITAMEVNIDGTGYSILKKDSDTPPTTQEELRIESVEEFFNSPYPKTSFTTIRRKLRFDMESTGNAFLEVIRNVAGLIIYLKRIDPKTMRMVRLGVPMEATKEVIRNGKKFDIKLNERPRAYAQKISSKLTYFKDYGTSFDIGKESGLWDDKKALPFNERGSEVLHFTVIDDPKTPYGLPRWINQIPSLIGSRNAEEYNLEYFDNGGIPPVLITVSGGVIAEQSKLDLDNILKGSAKSKMRGAVLETHSVGGDLSSSNKVDVKVEKFGNEQVKDSMFENYDLNCERRVRSSFRLPPLFVGKADDYSYATAYASYAIGEAQVFKPERFEFDEIINKTIMLELDAELVLKSKPLTIDNSEIQLKSVEIAATNGVIDGVGLVATLNKLTNLNMEYVEDSDLKAQPATLEVDSSAGKTIPTQALKGESNVALLASKWIIASGLDGSAGSKEAALALGTQVSALSKIDKAKFNKIVAVSVLADIVQDEEGAIDLCSCASDVLEG